MATETAERTGVFSFQVSRADLGPLVVDRLGLAPGEFSPLAPPLAGYAKGSGRLSAEAEPIAQEALAAKALRILADPSVRLLNQTGGGALAISQFTACHSHRVDPRAVAAIHPSFEGACLVQWFEDMAAYVAWWLILNATSTRAAVANYAPPPIRLEALVYLLHAVDAFRRRAYRSLLDYAPTERPAIAPAEFAESMQAAVRSRDMRWLLPALLNLTPNLASVTLEDRPEFPQALEQYGFLVPARERGTGEPLFVFGEAGLVMGVEFYRTWIQSVGFEATVRTPAGWRVAHRGFLAPTGLANHLFLFETDSAGACTVNHQAMGRDALDMKMMRLIGDAVEGKGLSAGAAAAPAPAARKAAARCPSCGGEVPEGSAFCNQCGARLSARQAAPAPTPTCKQCGAALAKGAKFCTHCGARSS